MKTIAKCDKSRQLSIEQENAIDLLIEGKSDREVAEDIGVSRQTVTEWRNGNVLFMATLNIRRKEIWGCQTERLRQMISRAVDILEEDLGSTDTKLRQAAAVHILRSVGLYGGSLMPKGPEDSAEIELMRKEKENDMFFRKIEISAIP